MLSLLSDLQLVDSIEIPEIPLIEISFRYLTDSKESSYGVKTNQKAH